MRIFLVLTLVVLAGCSQPADPPAANGAAEAVDDGETPAEGPDAIELAGSNVTWVGVGSVEWDLVVPNGVDWLEFSWYDVGDLNGVMVGLLTMDGCEDDPTSSTGASAGHRWCENPPPGKHHATYQLLAGQLEGRLCIIGLPEGFNDLGDCLGSPYA